MVRPSRQVLVWGFAAALVTYAPISAGFAQPAMPTPKAPPVPDPLTPDALLARAAPTTTRRPRPSRSRAQRPTGVRPRERPDSPRARRDS